MLATQVPQALLSAQAAQHSGWALSPDRRWGVALYTVAAFSCAAVDS